MRKGHRLAGLVAGAIIGCGAGDAEHPAPASDAPLISLDSVAVDTRDPSPKVPSHLRAESGEPAALRYVLVKFPGPITAEQDRALRSAAEQVYTYLPYYSYLVKMPLGEQSAGALARAGAIWSGPYHPYYKMARQIAAMKADAGAPRSVMIQVYPDADLDKVVGLIKAMGAGTVAGWQKGELFSRIRWMLTPQEIAAHRERLAQIPEVFWVDIEPKKELLNDTTIWVGQSGLNGGMTTPVFDHGIYGEGQVVGIIDTGIDPDMCYFRDQAAGLPPRNECNGGTVVDMNQRKVLAVDFLYSGECAGGISNTEWDTQNHGTHVAGTVAGDNFATPLLHDPGDGMAPGAKLVIQDGGYQVDNCGDLPGIGCPVVDLKPLFQQAYTQGARLHTNSWGDQENNPMQNNYTAACQDVDEFMWNHKDFQLFFAAGNSGPGAGSVGSPSTAKSAISVGATQHGANADFMANFSSCGPTDDGRIKPEITIPGQSVVSAHNDKNASSNNCTTTTMSGTSMASPGAAGLTALIRQYYTDGFYPSGAANPPDGFTPSAALLRATLINSGETMANGVIPANCQAWGRILLDNALYFDLDTRRLWVDDDSAGFPTGSVNEQKIFTFSVQAPLLPFKATLAWTDYPSTPAAKPHINNDLDLTVTGPGGTYHGNVFLGGESTTGGNPDRVNTLEQVFIKIGTPGIYTVTVSSFNVPNGPQPFALVVTGNAVPPGSLGAGCNQAADCMSGFCVDGVCCDTACNAGVCDSCSIAGGAASNGTCALFTGTPCDDGNGCTKSDTCQAGVCVSGSPVICAALDACHDIGTCDMATGMCDSPAKPDGAACDDGDRCTLSDTCQTGSCVGANPVICPMPDACHDVGVCDKVSGLCSNSAKADGTTCDDGDACSLGETCQAGVCGKGSPVVCPVQDACHVQGTCDATTGKCDAPAAPDGTPCPGGLCMGGVCNAASSSSGGNGSAGSSAGTGSGSGGAGGGFMVNPGEPGGCGCRMDSTSSQGGATGILLGLLLVNRRRRRRL